MTSAMFKAHMCTHFEHPCPHCDYTSRTEGRLKKHIKDFHSDDNDGHHREPTRPKILRCRQCDFSSADKVNIYCENDSLRWLISLKLARVGCIVNGLQKWSFSVNHFKIHYS